MTRTMCRPRGQNGLLPRVTDWCTFSPDWWETHVWKLDPRPCAPLWWQTIGAASETRLPN